MTYEVQYLGFSKDQIKSMKKSFKTEKAREKFITKGLEDGKIYQILAYSIAEF